MMLINRFSISIIIMTTLLMGQTVWATTYYVDRNLPGSDSNNGTSEATPYLTIQKCVTQLAAGDTCLVKNGTYTETPNLTFHSGTPGNPVTLKNFPGHTPIISVSSFGGAFGVDLNKDGTATRRLSYVTFEGFEVTGAKYTGIKFVAADHLIIRNNYVHHNSTVEVVQAGSGIAGTGVFITIDGNRVSFNGNTTLAPYGHNMYLIGGNYTIINNIVDQAGGFGIQCAAYPFGPTSMPNASYSGFHDSLIANNTFAYQRRGSGIIVWGGGQPTSGPGTGNIIENNIFYQNSQIGLAGVGGIGFLNPAPGIVVVRNNVMYATAPRPTSFIGGTAGVDYDASGGNTQGTNPNMVNAPATTPASPDFHLTVASTAAINVGRNIIMDGLLTAPVLDRDGVARPTSGQWEVGAYKFSNDGTSPDPPQGLQVR